jgi:hypothetical protein
MKTFEQTLLENLIRFQPKNINTNIFRKFLLEQDGMDFVRNWEYDNAVRAEKNKWETEVRNTGANKLVKMFGYNKVTSEDLKVSATFWNNFVTLDGGAPNADAVKKQMDNVLNMLQQQGANLQDPKVEITIQATATAPPASIYPAKNDNTGKTKIDHDYNGLLKFDANGKVTPESAAKFKEKQTADDQWGNDILARKRAESVANYIKSKGIKANIKVLPPLLKQPKREFIISARTVGTEKFIAPMTSPDIQITINLGVGYQLTNPYGGQMLNKDYPVYGNVLPTFGYTIQIKTPGVAGRTLSAKSANIGWLTTREAYMLSHPDQSKNAGTEPIAWRNPLRAKIGSEDQKFDPASIFLGGCGYFTYSAARAIIDESGILNGASAIVKNLINWDYTSWLKQSNQALGIKGDINILFSSNSGESCMGKIIESTEDLAKVKSTIPSLTQRFSKTFNLSELAQAAAAAGVKGVSPTFSTDLEYWQSAAWLDTTTTPATYGLSVSKNPNFFKDVQKVVQTPLEK